MQDITLGSLHQLNSYSEAQDAQSRNWFKTQKAESPEMVPVAHEALGVAEHT